MFTRKRILDSILSALVRYCEFRDSISLPALTAQRSKIVEERINNDPIGRQLRAHHWPMDRLSTTTEQAMAVVFLASDESSFLTAQDIVIDGGLTKVGIHFDPESLSRSLSLDIKFLKLY